MRALQAIRPRGATPRQVGYYFARLVALPWVRWRRRRFVGTTVIGVTGSAGKSTAVRVLETMLVRRGSVYASTRSSNTAQSLVEMCREIGPAPDFIVHELAAWAAGTMRELAWALEPSVGIVTTVGWDHYRAFRGPDGAAAEKAELVRALPARGLAVLNADDTRIRAMASQTRARVVLFGEAQDAAYRATTVTSTWPDRLCFELVHPGGRIPVATRLIGRHWVPTALAGLTAAIELGVPADEAAAALGTAEPEPARLSERDGGSGVTFLMDNFKAPVWTLWPALDVLRSARARRRVAVIGQLSDDPRRPRELYRRVVGYALGCAEIVVVVGRWAEIVRDVFPGQSGRVRVFEHVRDVHQFLEHELRPGDLVLLKGTVSSDHSERLVLARQRTVRCWRTACGRVNQCDGCARIDLPHDP